MAIVDYMTFGEVARVMELAKLERVPYLNRRYLEGTTISFFRYCEWFEVNVHDAVNMSTERVREMLTKSADTRLDNSHTDEYGHVEWFGGVWVQGHHVRVWYNPASALRALSK